jgi:hypothetical protein
MPSTPPLLRTDPHVHLILQAIVNGIASVLMAIVSCLTCGKCGGGRRGGGHTTTV